MDFGDIPLFPHCAQEYDVFFDGLQRWVDRCVKEGLDIDPPYQRAHVWTVEQQRAFVEHLLRGGEVSRVIIINAPMDRSGYKGATLLDGKQRLQAVTLFMDNKLDIFGGHYLKDFTGHMRVFAGRLHWRVCLPTEVEVLDLYLSINVGGTPHTHDEI
jgi:hypothetical protein